MPSRGRARYVLQVVPGRERAVAERVKALAGPELVRDCFALSYCILKKNQGVWRLLTETMFPGYLFVASDDIEAFEKTIKRSTAFARLLGAERRAFALRPEEASFVHDFGGPSHVVGFSRGTIDNGRTIIDEGPLRGHVDRIKKIDRHKRIAYLDIGLHDTMEDLLVNFIGAVVFCTFGFFYLKGRGKGKFVRRFVPTMRGASEGDVKGD